MRETQKYFAVVRSFCTGEPCGVYSSVIAVAPTRDIADDVCALAQLQINAAKEIPFPQGYVDSYQERRAEYLSAIRTILTVDHEINDPREEIQYEVEEVGFYSSRL